MRRILEQFRGSGTTRVSRQTLQGKAPSARSVALMMVRPADHRTKGQVAFLDRLCQHDATIATAFTLTQTFGQLLRKREGPQRLDQWKAAVRASGIAELIAFVAGLADDAEAVANGCTESWSNGMVEGFIKKGRICMLKHITIDTNPDGTPITIPTRINGIQATSDILGWRIAN